ncbi:dTDP-glucose 4,6-dehydratase [Anaerosolibacter carboniphilus]|uniref:dTDP-glucose 4,6-dehydratase n=1 Tax=Anaerosolibacter carboniphilus TaxID=1417629 RepID=A0A841KQG4_9FIRM|nr:dTDP-glucose 4,6-dehydratase [Anaerosolibacter carboniphilus]MBB6215726.1 dTDP-glucose 4,6-dehydratase [Anaerosolibacter carboniphilus]
MKTYLVTGGAGFIGSNFIRQLLNNHENIRIINVDKLTYAGNLENLKEIEKHPHYQFIQGDICDHKSILSIFKENDIDYVVNFAAESHVDRSIKDPMIFAQTNILGTVNLLNIAKKAWEIENGFLSGKKFVQISTDEVYGSLGATGYFTEDSPLDPHSPYSSSKASADLMIKAYYDTYKMPVNITRCSNNYGPYQFPEKLIPLMIDCCFHKKPLPIYGDGLNIRDWLYVEDHCKAIEAVIKNGTPGEVYNIGGNNERTNNYIVKTILHYVRENIDPTVTESLITYVEDRKGHDRRYAIDSSKIKNKLGWKPETNFEEGIIKTIQWYIENKEWMNHIVSGEYQHYKYR